MSALLPKLDRFVTGCVQAWYAAQPSQLTVVYHDRLVPQTACADMPFPVFLTNRVAIKLLTVF